jgi:hypothetical protein
MSDNFTVKSGIICDLIRQENNGKLIFIGVYAASIVAQAFPATLALSCIAILDASKTGEFPIEFETLLDGKSQGIGTGSIGVSKVGMSLLPFQNIVLNNISPGTLVFRMRELNKSWQTVIEIPIGTS